MIIGISGKIGTGKTTVANILVGMCERHGIKATKMSFADLVRDEVSRKYDFPRFWCTDAKDAMVPLRGVSSELLASHWGEEVTVREILQYYATEIVRGTSPNYWVDALHAKAMTFLDNDNGIIFIDDVRFLNEWEYCNEHGICVRLSPYSGWGIGPHSGHISETALDTAQFTSIFHPAFGELHITAQYIFDRFCAQSFSTQIDPLVSV